MDLCFMNKNTIFGIIIILTLVIADGVYDGVSEITDLSSFISG